MAYLHNMYTGSACLQNVAHACQSIPDEFCIAVPEALRHTVKPLFVYQVIENCHFLLMFSCKLICTFAPTG